MRKLILMRHAKSSWDNPELKDFDRDLNSRGLRNAPEMGLRLKQKNWPIDLLLSSTAVRAKHTAALVATSLSYPLSQIEYASEIYEAELKDLSYVLQNIDQSVHSALLVGHNPALTYFTEFLCNCGHIHIPTAGMMYIELQIANWQQLKPGCGKLVEFDFPKRDPFDPD